MHLGCLSMMTNDVRARRLMLSTFLLRFEPGGNQSNPVKDSCQTSPQSQCHRLTYPYQILHEPHASAQWMCSLSRLSGDIEIRRRRAVLLLPLPLSQSSPSIHPAFSCKSPAQLVALVGFANLQVQAIQVRFAEALFLACKV